MDELGVYQTAPSEQWIFNHNFAMVITNGKPIKLLRQCLGKSLGGEGVFRN